MKSEVLTVKVGLGLGQGVAQGWGPAPAAGGIGREVEAQPGASSPGAPWLATMAQDVCCTGRAGLALC